MTDPTTEPEPLALGGKIMPLFGHLSELRVRLVKSLTAITGMFCICLFFATPMINFLKKPLQAALPMQAQALHFTGPLEVLFADMKVAFVAAVIFASPIWIFQFWKFIEPALYVSERKYMLPFVWSSIVLFLLGVTFCFYLIIPMCLEFLMTMGMEVGAPMITVSDYLSLILLMTLGFGFIFETPLVLILLAALELINSAVLTAYRKFVVVGILVVAAILTPPDPLSQVAMAVPMYLLYELSILLIRAMEKRSK